MTPLTMLTWGYDGWGSATVKLKQAVDRIEGERRYEPPYFVDIRMRRNVRADGFREAAFEEVIGKDRYRWMPSLGNKWVKSHAGPKLQINEPHVVEELLGLALARRDTRRVIFFCACSVTHEPRCHRFAVASLLLKAARRRNVDLTITEWPGGNPKRIAHELTDSQAESLLAGKRNLSLGRRMPSPELLGLPWDSIVQFRAPGSSFHALADHARFRGGEWLLPLPFGAAKADSPIMLKKRAKRDRLNWGLGPRRTVSGRM